MRSYLKKLLLIIFAFTFFIPTLALAEGEEESEDKAPVVVYLFRGEGCPHCEEALEWFNSEETQEKYGKYFTIESYEVWNSANNNDLMNSVAEYLGEDSPGGVPYMVIGKHTYGGFDSSDTETLIDYIMEEYEKDEDERDSVIPTVIEKTGWKPDDNQIATQSKEEGNSKTTDIIVGVVVVIVVVGLVAVIIKARKSE